LSFIKKGGVAPSHESGATRLPRRFVVLAFFHVLPVGLASSVVADPELTVASAFPSIAAPQLLQLSKASAHARIVNGQRVLPPSWTWISKKR